MKKKNLKFILGLAVIAALNVSCKNDDVSNPKDDTPNADKLESVNKLIQDLKEKPQTFTVSLKEKDTVIKGKGGTVITLAKDAVKDDSGKPVDSLNISLNEYLSLNDMILNNIQTTSNNQLLVTGGSFDLGITDTKGNPLNVDPTKLSASIPVKTNPDSSLTMQYYTGERKEVDGREVVDWTLEEGKFGMGEDGMFNIFGLDKGLSNCDVLYNMASESPTQFEATASNVTDYSKTTIWLFIKDFPSVVVLTQQNADKTALQTYENSIPKGLNGILVAITTDDNNYLQFGKLDISVAGDDKFDIPVNYGTTAELKTLLSGL